MLKAWRAERRGVAALEFALLAPVIVGLFFGVYELSNALIVYEEVYAATHAMAASITNEAVQSDGTNALSYTQIQQGESMLWGEVPALRAGQQDGVKSVTVSSIVFEQTSSSCTAGVSQQCDYVPVVAWSVSYAGGDSGRTFQTAANVTRTGSNGYVKWSAVGAPLRSCVGKATIPAASSLAGSLNQTVASGGLSSDLTNLRTLSLTSPAPSNPAPPSPILVVDVHLTYSPVIGLIFAGGLDLWVNADWPVRSVKTNVSSNYQLYEAFTTLTPSVPSGTTATKLNGYASNNVETEIYDAAGNLVSLNAYCVNTALYSTAFPYPAETQ